MNIDIRKSIKNNFKDSDLNEIKNSVEDSINNGDEITLPGLGVFFEILWNESDENNRMQILENIKKGL